MSLSDLYLDQFELAIAYGQGVDDRIELDRKSRAAAEDMKRGGGKSFVRPRG